MTPTEMYAKLTTGDRQGPAFEALLAEWNALPYATQSKVIAATVPTTHHCGGRIVGGECTRCYGLKDETWLSTVRGQQSADDYTYEW